MEVKNLSEATQINKFCYKTIWNLCDNKEKVFFIEGFLRNSHCSISYLAKTLVSNKSQVDGNVTKCYQGSN